MDGSLAPVPCEDLDPTLVRDVQHESNGYTLDVLKDRLRPRDVEDTNAGGEEYIVPDAATPNGPSNVTNLDAISECELSELPNSIHSEDKTYHDALFVQSCVEQIDHTHYATLENRCSPRGERSL